MQVRELKKRGRRNPDPSGTLKWAGEREGGEIWWSRRLVHDDGALVENGAGQLHGWLGLPGTDGDSEKA